MPAPVQTYLHDLVLERRSPAYLLVDREGCLSDWGGALGTYGIANPEAGGRVGRQVAFLEALLPSTGSPLILPQLEISPGRFADVHIVPGDQGDWVLLLDATPDARERGLLRQAANELGLLRERQHKILRQYIGKDIDVIGKMAEGLLAVPETGERRAVSVLHAGVKGFTAYCEATPPATAFETLGRYLRAIVDPVVAEAGVVATLAGETATAIFGVLPSDGPAPARAVSAAMRIIERAKEAGRAREAERHPVLGVGVGIASGPVALVITGLGEQRTLTAVGYRVNLAALLESEARPGEILADEATFLASGDARRRFAPTALTRTAVAEPAPFYACWAR